MDINQIKLDNKFKLVEASAGTGKSFTLAHIVLRNVLEKKVTFPVVTYFFLCDRQRKINATSMLISSVPMIFIFGLARKYQFFTENEYILARGR